ncbi:MAG: response regulator transcription factor [Verrucomicrobiota bacterium]
MNQRLRALIVDDERLARQRLSEILAEEHQHDIVVVGEAGDVRQAAALAAELCPDVVFLDVQMAPENGFSLLPHLADISPQPSVIFVTAHDTYAVAAFEANALDYLLKPIRPERLAASIQRLKSSRERLRASETPSSAAPDSENQGPHPLSKQYEPEDFLALKDGRSQWIIRAHEIRVIQAQGTYSKLLIDNDRSVTVRITISDWDACLPPRLFKKISRSTLVNVPAVASLAVLNRDQVEVVFHGLSEPIVLSRLESQRLRAAGE